MAVVEVVEAKITADTAQFDRSMKRVSGSFANVGAAAKKGMKIAGVAVAASATAIAAKGITAFAGFETAMNEVGTLMPDITNEAFSKMGDDVLEFGKKFGVMTDDTVPALYSAISAGVPQGNVFDFLEVAQKAAAAGVTDLEVAVDGITSVINGYGKDIEDATEVSDLMFTAVKLGKTDMEQMAKAMSVVVPTASALEVGFADVSAALALMTSKGKPTQEAANQIRSALQELGKDGTVASDAFAAMSGQTFPDFISAGGDLAGAVEIMALAAEEAGTSVGNMFSSSEAGGAFQVMADDIDGLISNMDAMDTSAGATETAFETMDQGLTASMNKIKANAEVLMIQIGSKLAPVVAKAMDWIVLHFDDFKAAGKKAFELVKKKFDDLKPTIKTISDEAKKFADWFMKKVVPALKKAGDKAKELGGWLKGKLQPPMEKVIEFAKDLSDAFSRDGLSGVVDELKRKLEPIGDWMNNNTPILAGFGAVIASVAAIFVGQMLVAMVAWIGQMVVATAVLWGQAAAFIAAYAPIVAIIAAIALLTAGVVWAYQNVGWFKTGIDAMKDAAVAAFVWLKDNVPPIIETIVGMLMTWVEWHVKIALFVWDMAMAIGNAIGAVIGFFRDMWDKAWAAATAIGLAVSSIIEFFTSLPSDIKTKFGEGFQFLKDKGAEAKDWLKEHVIDKIVGFITGIPGRVGDVFGTIFGGMGDAFKNGVNDLITLLNNFSFSWDSKKIGALGKEVTVFPGGSFDPFDIEPLAKGGIVTRPTLAMIGEGGESEAVIPLSRLSSMTGNGGGSGGTSYTITVNTGIGDPGQIGAGVVDAITAYERRNGTSWRAS